ncbi:MAG TPA: GH1 family beta-glucosidase [Rugosimonospora sp.]|nr:GH1 family beta-glucosidase [Rugosimonospora sp.]
MGFPADFQWGVSTAAYQIEGGTTEDGRGPSIWDTFTHETGRVADGGTGDVACDHYHRYREDVALLADLGVGGYRFSLAWPRIQPGGTGTANPAGIAFYDRLVDELLGHGIDPVATLYHWDLPQPLQDAGGWLNRDTAYRFAEYADLAGAALGDRVKLWITLNEPVITTVLGYGTGVHAPGETLLFDALPTAHHQLLGHGLAVAALRARTSSPITIANNYTPVRVLGDTEADHAAAAVYDALHNRLFSDPLFGLGYPDLFELPVRDGDLATIAAPIDALGVNYYSPTGIRAPSDVDSPLPFDITELSGYEVTDFGWPVVPEALTELLLDLHGRYGAPLYVTESGCAYAEYPEDPRRIAYLSAHVDAVDAALTKGAAVRGYFVWSIMDNFEWAEGYTKRFGLVHVDFESQVRTPRSSYHWYRQLIASTR